MVGAKVVVVDKVSAVNWSHVDPSLVPTIETVINTESTDGIVGFDDLVTSSEPLAIVEVDTSHLAVLDLHQRHRRIAAGGDAQPRQPAGQHRPEPCRREGTSTATTSSTACCRCSTSSGSTWCSASLCRAAPRSCSCSASTRRRPSQSIQDRKVTVIPGAPPLWVAFPTSTTRPPTPSPPCASRSRERARCPRTVAEAMRERFGLEIREGYGLTEASPIVTTSDGLAASGSARSARCSTASRSDSSTTPATTRSTATPARSGSRAPNVFQGYFDDPEATAAVLTTDGWLRTGDIAITDDDGYLYLVDRGQGSHHRQSGSTCTPPRSRRCSSMHPDVAEVGVVGVPHPHTGEAVKAVRRAAAGRRPRRGHAHRALPRPPGPLQVPHRRSSSSMNCPATSAASWSDAASTMRCAIGASTI